MGRLIQGWGFQGKDNGRKMDLGIEGADNKWLKMMDHEPPELQVLGCVRA